MKAGLQCFVSGMRKARANGTASLILLLACCFCAFALDPSLDISQYAHNGWKIGEGFSKGAIHAMVQTPDGYLWLGTEFGLLRFDGARTVPWQPPTGEDLPSSDIRSLLATPDGTVWIGTVKGLASWKDGKLTQYPELAGHVVQALLEDRAGTVWAGGWRVPTGRLCTIESGKLQCSTDNGNLGYGVQSLYEDSGGNLWAGAQTGLWRWRPGPPKLYRMPEPVPDIQGLTEGENGVLLMNMGGGLRQLVNGKVEPYALVAGRKLSPEKLLRDRNGGLWFGTGNAGLLHVHRGKMDVFRQSDGLSGDRIYSLFEDREGDIWVGTHNGLDRFRDITVATISVNQGLSNATVGSVLTAADGSIWLGTLDGLNRWKDGQITIYRKRTVGAFRLRSKGKQAASGLPAASELGAPRTVREITDSGLPEVDQIDSLLQDDQGRIWVSTHRGVAYLENGRFIPVRTMPDGTVFSIAQDTAGDFWFSNQEHGLIHLSGRGAVEQIPWASLGGGGVAMILLPDPVQGGLWLGFWQGGVSQFKDGRVRASYEAGDGLGRGRVSNLRFGSDGTLWAATEGGLSRIKNGKIVTLTSRNGLPCDTVHWSMEDDDHDVWLSTACGLVRIVRSELAEWTGDPGRTVHTTVFDNSDGVRSHASAGVYSPSVAWSADSKLWFLPGDGVSIIDPHHLLFNKLAPPVHIEKITADDKTYDVANGMHLPALLRNLAIDYTALSLVVPEKVHFRYMLEGQDKEWREVVNDRQVQYSNLPPKHYRFRVTACNNSGVWSEEGATLDFVIPPAWYQTNWFRALCAGLLVALIYAGHRFRVRQLQHQEKKLRDVIETVPTFAWTARPDGFIDFANRNWMEYSGLSTDQTVGSGWQVAVHEADFKQHTDKWRAAVERGTPFENEVRLRRADGQYRWFLVRGVPLHDARGKIVRWYGTWTDIEDRRRAEEALRRSEAYLNEAQKLTRTCSWASDGTTREVLYWSDEAFRIFGVDPKKGMVTRDQAWQKIHPEDRAKVKAASDKTFREKVDYEVEYRIVLPDGTVKHIHSLGHPVLNADGDIVEVVGTNIDITARKLSEAALRRSEAYLAGAQKLTHTGSWAIDGKSRELRYWSEEMFRMYGFDPQEGLPRIDQARQRIHREDRDKVEKRDDKTFFDRTDSDVEFRIVLPDGTIKHIHALAHPVLDTHGELVEVVGTNVDITDRKRAEQLQADLAHTNRVSMLGELAASIAHEVNQPLSGIVSNASATLRFLAGNAPDLEEVREATRDIVRDGKRAGDIIHRLRSLYKKIPPKSELVDVNEIIREMVVMLRGEANRYAVSIRTDLTSDLPRIRADSVQLQQVLMNLMLNGIEAMKDTGGVLTVKSQLEDGHVLISVSDTGVGLPPEKAERIFDAFFTTKPQGSGMGLAISRSIVESHGGRLWATPNDGRGARFYFSLPTSTETVEAPAAEA